MAPMTVPGRFAKPILYLTRGTLPERVIWHFPERGSQSITDMTSWISSHRSARLFGSVRCGIPGSGRTARTRSSGLAHRWGSERPRVIAQLVRSGARALLAMMAGDTLMFVMGRYTGWWFLGVTLPHLAQSRIVHFAFRGFLLSARAGAARRRKVHTRNQHHGAAARRLHEYESHAVPRAGFHGRCRRSIPAPASGSASFSAAHWKRSPVATRRSAGSWVGW